MKKNQKLAHISGRIRLGRYRYTIHAAQRRIKRGITREEIEQVLTKGEIIEEYPSHHYGEACLLFGKTAGGGKYYTFWSRSMRQSISLPCMSLT